MAVNLEGSRPLLEALLQPGGRGGRARDADRLVVRVWTETLRNEQLAATLEEGFDGMRQVWAKLVDEYRGNGLMGADVPVGHVARTLAGTAQGFIAQRVLFGDVQAVVQAVVQADVLDDGLRALMSMRDTKIS